MFLNQSPFLSSSRPPQSFKGTQQNNNNNNNNYNSNNNQKNRGNNQNGIIGVAVYPKASIQSPQLEIQNFGGVSAHKSKYQVADAPYLKYTIRKNEINQLTRSSDTSQYSFCEVPENRYEEEVWKIINDTQNVSAFFDNGTLNLSEIKSFFPSLRKQPSSLTPEQMGFLLFLFSIKSKELHHDVIHIDASNNEQRDTNGFKQILSFFPKLESIDLSNNPITFNDQSYRPFIPSDNSNRKEIEVIIESTNSHRFSEVETPKPFKIEEICFDRASKHQSERIQLTFDHFIPTYINQEESPIHQAIVQFHDLSWNDLPNIGNCYMDEAVFSITLDFAPKNGPLYRAFKNFNSDFLDNQCVQKVGPQEIAQYQTHLFGGGFYSHITSYAVHFISEHMSAIVLHGAFVKPNSDSGDLFCYDRSLLFNNGEMKIANDHMFIRTPTHPELSDHHFFQV